MMNLISKKLAKTTHGALLVLAFCILSVRANAQGPIADSVKARQKVNEKMYRQLETMDKDGESYSFTNVIQWKIDDNELRNQIIESIRKPPIKFDSLFRIDDVFLFSAPSENDRVEPFHILLKGVQLTPKTGKKKSSGLGGIGGDEDEDEEQVITRAIKGKQVIPLMRRNHALLENVNVTQGSNVELPGEIVPTGTQLVKDVQMRYALSRMFSDFYSKKVILDAQRALYGLPTSDAMFQENYFAQATQDTKDTREEEDTTGESGMMIDSTLLSNSGALPEDVPIIDKMGRFERMFDLSANHLRVNATNNFAFELGLGNPEIGLPFWSSGQGNFSLIMRNMIGTESDFSLGLAFPVSVFGKDFGKYDEFLWSKRNLSGGFGARLSAYFAGIDFFSAFNLPVAFNVTFNPAGSDSNKSMIYNGEAATVYAVDGSQVIIPEGKTFYRTSLVAQLYVPTILQLDLNSFLNVSVGFGIHNVQQSIIPTKAQTNGLNPKRLFEPEAEGKVQDIRRVSVPFNPLVSIQYVNHRASKFGIGVAFDHLFTFSGWIELINDRLRLETSYSSAVIRDPKPWEPSSFFQITPRFYF